MSFVIQIPYQGKLKLNKGAIKPMATSVIQNATQAASTSTSTFTVDTNTVDIKSYNETYRVYAKTKADGKIDAESIRMVTAGKDGKTWEKLDAPESGYTQAFEQTVKVYEAGSMAGAAQIVEDPVECTNIWNKGASQKMVQRLKAEFIEISDDGTQFVFDPKPEAYDTLELLGSATQRRNLSPIDKAKTLLRNSVKLLYPTLEGDALEAKVAEFFATLGS